jgi:hypothetical protein
MNKHFKVWYTGPMIEWILDRIIVAGSPEAAINHMTDNYPWAEIIDWQEVQHASLVKEDDRTTTTV